MRSDATPLTACPRCGYDDPPPPGYSCGSCGWLRLVEAEGRGTSCFCGQPDDRERVHRAHECVPWVSREAGRATSRSVEQDGRGEWHWFCLRDGCRWSGMDLLTEDGANREADRHDKEFHP